jgi:hypothetical protein
MNRRLWTGFALAVTMLGCKQDASQQGIAGLAVAGTGMTTVAGVGVTGVAGVGVTGVAGAGVMGVAGAGVTGVAGASVTGTAGMSAVSVAGQGAAGALAAAGAGSSGNPNSFSNIYMDIIVGVGCNGGMACHAGTVGNLTMTSKEQAYAALVGVKAMGMSIPTTMNKAMNCKDSGLTRVVPGKPDESLLMLKVLRTPTCGDPMPVAPLAADKVAQIRAWISNGARND